MRLSSARKNTRAFLKQRIKFHYEGFAAAKKAREEAIDLIKTGAAANAGVERAQCLRNAAKEHRNLADWHMERVAKLREEKKKRFMSNGK